MLPSAVADALLAVAWAALALDTLWQVRRERHARATLGPALLPLWRPPAAAGVAVLAVTLAGAAVLERLAGRLPYRPGVAFVGLALVAAGLGLDVWARRVLGPLWSGAITVRAAHTVVTHGPYAYVRHPIYLAVLLLGGGTLLAHPSIATACVAGGLAVGLALKIRLEERALRAALGSAYAAYAARVPALIPALGASRDRRR